MEIHEILVQSADAGLLKQNKQTGAFPSGHNGPYHDEETSVRNTSHWLLVILKAYKITGNEKYFKAAGQAVEYLCGDEARPMDYTFWHRKNPEKDSCNGLIGQAWTIEALVEAYRQLEIDECIEIAEEVFLMHPYSVDRNIWQRVAADGRHLPFDKTFNHQLWFAMAGGLLFKETGNNKIRQQVMGFLDRLKDYLLTYDDGLIYHPLKFKQTLKDHLKNVIKWILFSSRKHRQKLYNKAIGYHSFNLYALAVLKTVFPDNTFWASKKMRKILQYGGSDNYKKAILDNKFGFPYNPPGIEMAYALQVFELDSKDIKYWLQTQIEQTMDAEGLMTRNASDKQTCQARIYEATRLRNYTIPEINFGSLSKTV